MAEIKNLLDEVIEKEIQELDALPAGDEKAQAIRDLTQLHKLRIEEIKAQTEVDKIEQSAQEIELKKREADGKDADRCREGAAMQQQVRDAKIDRYVRTGVSVAELVLPLVFYGIWMRQGFKFEENGSFTSTTFKNLLNRFRPMK